MGTIPVRALRNESASVLDRVSRGERLTVTKDGTPVAEIIPLRRRPLSAEELIARRAHLPDLDLDELRRDIDNVLDPSL